MKHLHADWLKIRKGVVFSEYGKESEQPYIPDNATKIFNMGKTSVTVWAFIKAEAAQVKAETLVKSHGSANGKPR